MIRRIFPKRASAPTIFRFVSEHVDPAGVGLLPGGDELPDTVRSPNELSWAPGAFDGVGTHHLGGGGPDAGVAEIFDLLRKTIASNLRPTDFGRLYERLRQDAVLQLLDPLLEKIRTSPLPVAGLRRVGHRLATEGRHREPVKFGIALCGLLRGNPERDVLMILGRHEEFTLYCAVAVANTETDPEPLLWQMARAVEGWGRVHVVERLKSTNNPDIQQWLLRGGFRNAVMDEYLAYIAATTGNLIAALRREDLDDELFDGAGDIISALLAGGPAEDIDDYADAPEAVTLFVGHLDRRASKLRHLLIAHVLEVFLAADDDWAGRYDKGWTPQQRDELTRRVHDIKEREMWPSMASAGLSSEDPRAFFEADRASRLLGVDTFAVHWQRVQADPINGPWYGAMNQVTDEHIDEVVSFAAHALPLDAIATGPGDAMGFGPEFAPHRALDFIVPALAKFPGKGWPLINASLRSPVVRNRNMAIKVLDNWDKEAWPPESLATVGQAVRDEPREDVKERLQALLD